MDNETQRKIMQHIGKVFEQRMNSALIGGDVPQVEYTTTQSQPSEPMTLEKLEQAMKLLRETVPPNPYRQYQDTHEWRFPERHREAIMEALKSPDDTLLGMRPMFDQLYGIPVVWTHELIDQIELRPSPQRIARLKLRLEMEAALKQLDAKYHDGEVTLEEYNREYLQVMQRYEPPTP